MDWDKSQVSYSMQMPAKNLPNEKNFAVIQSKFRQFLREFRRGNVEETFYYREKLQINYDEKQFKIVIDFQDLMSFDQDLCENFREDPVTYLPLFETAALEVIAMTKVPKPAKKDMSPMQVQIVNLPTTQIAIRRLQATEISKLVRVPGIIVSATKPSSKAIRLTLQCTNCRATITRASARGFGSIQLPRTCENSTDEKNDKPCPLDPFMIVADKCSFVDVQRLRLQESPEDIPTGEMPRHLMLYCGRKLVNRVRPGARVNIIGIYKIFDARVKNGRRSNDRFDSSVRKPYIEVVGIEDDNVHQKRGSFTAEEEEIIRDLSRRTNVPNVIAQSIAPAIWGNDDIKKAIACLLFGGSRKILPDGMRLRGDINVLLLGDPSLGKSQFLKFVNDVAPIAVYTSGKGSSAAGLTASVIKDPATKEFHLEAGAMVLADGGVVCIDEFDKMRESDRVAIHEAMEQQTISIAKAGITTILNSRTSVLAAANPVFGRYDGLRSTTENIDFEATILSRFDLIFILRDIKNAERDTRLAQHVMDLHTGINTNVNDANKKQTANIAPDLLSKYISYARHRVHPRLTRTAADMLSDHYVMFRRETKLQAQETGQMSGIPLTVRQLESLVRLSESLAKMELSLEANEEHVKEAVRLFKVSTLKAAKEGSFSGEGALADPAVMQQMKKCERNIKRRLPLGSKSSVSKLVTEMGHRNISESIVLRTLNIMQRRGEIAFHQRRRQVQRKK